MIKKNVKKTKYYYKKGKLKKVKRIFKKNI